MNPIEKLERDAAAAMRDAEHQGRRRVRNLYAEEVLRRQLEVESARFECCFDERQQARRALLALVESLYEDEKPRQRALCEALETLRAWGMRASWDKPADVVREARELDPEERS